ncbi:hypothetical protein T552_02208 [Pneumocystis carinii B80]|uniref:Cytochrome c oxidase assembly factor 6 n=1 Tax=Pneumocystis carinii (strain B80) TaxID=1408658 RepID=A0A0W4ZHE2_PNEC8|nr:hypothetical protein T552_02208 [Pneumocystis carinii B80]KTW27768.1 hypothetical protein T552_02208 [Pneumocystis carinii B80]
MISIANIPPTKSQRERCWQARDIFFQCLDKHSIINPITQIEKINSFCSLEEESFRNNCAKSWIDYFKKKRLIDFQNRFYKNYNNTQNSKL